MSHFTAFLGRRLAGALLTFLTLIAVTFVVYWSIPATPAGFLYPFAAHLTNYQLQHGNHLLGLDRPKLDQYGDYLWHLLHGDFGGSWRGGQIVDNDHLLLAPIGPQLFAATRESLSIILGGALLVLVLALPLGAFAGRRIGSAADRLISTATLVGICTHPMVLGLILATTLGVEQSGVIDNGYCPLRRGPKDTCGGLGPWTSHLILPWITFALLFLALYVRMVRASVADTLHEDYVRTARAKGAGELRVMRHHVLPSAGLRVLTMVGMEVGTALGVCIYIEAAFGFQGLGRLAVTVMGGAADQIDLPFTLAVVTIITVIVLVGNLVVDVLYAVLDPRAARETSRGRDKPLVGGVF
ncbi:MAG TPA: ABC transporter permease [Gaiellaceae bacterium]